MDEMRNHILEMERTTASINDRFHKMELAIVSGCAAILSATFTMKTNVQQVVRELREDRGRLAGQRFLLPLHPEHSPAELAQIHEKVREKLEEDGYPYAFGPDQDWKADEMLEEELEMKPEEKLELKPEEKLELDVGKPDEKLNEKLDEKQDKTLDGKPDEKLDEKLELDEKPDKKLQLDKKLGEPAVKRARQV